MSFHANLLALPPRHRIENGGDETIPGGNVFFFLFFFTYLFPTPGNLNSFFAAICREILFSYTLFRNGGNFVIRSIILGMLLISQDVLGDINKFLDGEIRR